MKKIFLMLCLGLALTGCQQPPAQENVMTNERQEAAKKLFAQSVLLLQQKDLKGAVTSLQASIKINPTNPDPYLFLGQILLKAEQYEQAAEFLDQTAKTFPDNGTVFYMFSIANKMAGKKLPAILAARRSYEIFKNAQDADNAQSSAVLLEELVKSAQEDQKAQDAKNQAVKEQPTVPVSSVSAPTIADQTSKTNKK